MKAYIDRTGVRLSSAEVDQLGRDGAIENRAGLCAEENGRCYKCYRKKCVCEGET